MEGFLKLLQKWETYWSEVILAKRFPLLWVTDAVQAAAKTWHCLITVWCPMVKELGGVGRALCEE